MSQTPQSTPERINQFASLQSSRQEKREKFQKDDTWQRGACAFPSLCISFKVILTTSLEIRREVFFLLDCRVAEPINHATCQIAPRVDGLKECARRKNMAEFSFRCPQCRQPIEADESYCGQTAQCPHCGRNIVVPKTQSGNNLASCKVKTSKGAGSQRTMFCTNCGAPIAEQAVMCPKCGMPVRENSNFPNGAMSIPNHLAGSILAMIFCCQPFGIPAIVYAAQVNSRIVAGDIGGAIEASKKANIWMMVSISISVIFWVLYFIGAVIVHLFSTTN